jgi:hypothetical protein
MRIVLALLSLALVACATAGPAKPKSLIDLKPSDIDKSLAPLDAKKPFQSEKHKLEIEKTGVKKYDDFLTEAAAVKGSVVVTNVVMDDIEGGMSDIVTPPPAPAADAKSADAKPADANAKPADANAKPADAKTDAKPADAKPADKKDDKPVDDDALANAVAKKRSTSALDPVQVQRIHDDTVMLDALVDKMKDLPARAKDVTSKGQALAQAATQELTKDPFNMAPVPGALTGALGQVASAATDAPGAAARAATIIKAIAICGCSTPSNPIEPKDVSPALASLYDKNPFANDDTRVDTVVTGLADYDAFFKEAAVIRGSVVLVDVWVKDVGATLADIAKAPVPTNAAELEKLAKSLKAKKTKASGDVVGKLKNHVAQLTAIVAALAQAPLKAKDLVPKGQKLATSVAQDALKAPAAMAGVPGAVEESGKAIADSAKKAADVLPALKNLAAPLTSIAG